MLKSKIDKYYDQHNCQRICQGDILKDFKFNTIKSDDSEVVEYYFPFIIILSQDCDLQYGLLVSSDLSHGPITSTQYLHNIIFVPAFPVDAVKSGEHLLSLFNIIQDKLDSKQFKLIKKNRNERYHYLINDLDLQIPELLIDFKAYYTLSQEYFSAKHKPSYVATINELFRERLSQRFSNYINRIGVPEIQPKSDLTSV